MMAAISISSLPYLPTHHESGRAIVFRKWSCLGGSLKFKLIQNRRPKFRFGAAIDDEQGGGGGGEEVTPAKNTNDISNAAAIPKSKREMLLEYVRNVQPEFLEIFVKRASPQVVEAMRQTVTNMIGTLPPQFFVVTVTTVAENLAQLMYSVIMTGYMFKNAHYRLELQKSLEQVAQTEKMSSKEDPNYAAGTQKKLSGEVIRWRHDSGPEKIDAVKYIELLESEIDELKQQLKRREAAYGQNEILEYLKTLEPQNLQELTSSAGEETLEAMNTFIQRLLGVSDPTKLRVTPKEATAVELWKLLYWLMVVGYSIRNIEVRFDMERVLGMPAKLPELPPGENV